MKASSKNNKSEKRAAYFLALAAFFFISFLVVSGNNIYYTKTTLSDISELREVLLSCGGNNYISNLTIDYEKVEFLCYVETCNEEKCVIRSFPVNLVKAHGRWLQEV